MNRLGRLGLGLVFAAGVLSAAGSASANDRHFGYTYETAVLPPGHRELEVWTTWRGGRDSYYSRFDHRLEFEVGVTGQLMTAFYLNFHALTEKNAEDVRESRFVYDGVSSEWKLKLSDPVADAIGSAGYLEFTAGPSLYEIEAKLLLDKRLGNILIAGNLVGEVEWEVEPEETKRELVASPVIGVSYVVSPSFAAGLEVRNENVIEEGEVEASMLSAGPTIAVSDETYWATLSFLPQITDLKAGKRNTTTDSAYELRLLFSFHL
ncbi:MAG: hypothetical protein R3B07_00065 [Polyangiaceae bacterium]